MELAVQNSVLNVPAGTYILEQSKFYIQVKRSQILTILLPATNLSMLIIFANSLDPDQARRKVGPDLDPNCLTHLWYSWKNIF